MWACTDKSFAAECTLLHNVVVGHAVWREYGGLHAAGCKWQQVAASGSKLQGGMADSREVQCMLPLSISCGMQRCRTLSQQAQVVEGAEGMSRVLTAAEHPVKPRCACA